MSNVTPGSRGLIARTSITINAALDKVWDALVNPAAIKQYMFDTTAVSDWKEGSPIFWRGDWQGKPYEDKGVILKFKPKQILSYSHFSSLTGLPDIPENYHNVTLELSGNDRQTTISLSQDNNANEEERDHSANNWKMMLDGLKKFVES